MKLIIGLGNLDKEYAKTRHNVGHMFIDSFKGKEPTSTILGKNTGYMNESGFSVQKLVHFYKPDLNDFYLVHDDLDLPVGEYRLQFDRGPAGHHGVESVIRQLGTQAFWRIRIGIGRSPEHIPVEKYVLEAFSTTEKVLIDQTIDKILAVLK